MKSNLRMQAVVKSRPTPDPSGPLDEIALFKPDGSPFVSESGDLNVGPKGDPGSTGPQGVPGVKGDTGASGQDAFRPTGIPIVNDVADFNVPYTNTYGQLIEVNLQVGIICDPGDNGHVYLDAFKPDFTQSARLDIAACRVLFAQNTGLPGDDGLATMLKGKIPIGWIYQFTTEVILGTPTFIMMTAPYPPRTIFLV